MIIHNTTIITWEAPNRILRGFALRVVEDRITEIDEAPKLLEMYPQDERIDAGGQLLMPGLICAHTHFYGLFSRGMAIHGDAPADFVEILQKLWWPLDQSLREEDIYYSTLLSATDAIKHGTTTVFDHHASPSAILGSLDVIEKAVSEVGLRTSLCYEVTDRGGAIKTEEGIQENLRMIEKTRSYPAGSLVTAMFGLHAGLTLSDETLKRSAESIQEGYGFHIHVAEHQSDEFNSFNRHGKKVIDRRDAFGITGKDSIFVHGVHLDLKELEIIRDTGTWLTHQPRSNMNNAVGMASVEGALRYGIPVCMGNDGFSFAMWDEWRACYLAHKLWNRDPRSMPGDLVSEMGAVNNAKLASQFFKDRIGTIEVGAKADLILVDYKPITDMTEGNLPWHILFGFRDSQVTTTIINGKTVMKDRVISGIDEAEIAQRAVGLSQEVWKRYQKQF
jgi:putative selenium metabolism protein SsnA